MAPHRTTTLPRTPCELCPLRARPAFRDFDSLELSFVSAFKIAELSFDPGSTIITEGQRHPQLYTALAGWGFRYKILEDGRRQILNYVLPGDLIGLQGNLMAEMLHSVEALSRMTLCIFERDRLVGLFKNHPSLAYDLTWMAAREESMLDEHLLSIGRRTALERAAYLLAFLDHRAQTTGVFSEDAPRILPLTQQHVADTLGLSLVHTNKTLRRLLDAGVVRWLDRGCEVLEREKLFDIAGWRPSPEGLRPFI